MNDLFETTGSPPPPGTRPDGQHQGPSIRAFDITVERVRDANWRELFEGFDRLRALTF
jgi:hypothetical protein